MMPVSSARSALSIMARRIRIARYQPVFLLTLQVAGQLTGTEAASWRSG